MSDVQGRSQASSHSSPQGEGTPVNALLACERARADAVVAGDLNRLAGWLADDLVYVHGPGQRHYKAQVLDHWGNGPGFLASDLPNPSRQGHGGGALVLGDL